MTAHMTNATEAVGLASAFIRDAWYVAAWERDLASTMLAVKLLGEEIVLFRQSSGSVAALQDACVHRRVPLSMGRIKGDQIECAYHGLRYDASGACTHVPCSDWIPRNARVRSYPVVSRYGLLWIWMGNPESADPATIMTVEHWDDPQWATTHGDQMLVDCQYLYMTDNLLDPSHVAWVHPTSFGDAACEATPIAIAATKNSVVASRWMHSTTVAPIYRQFVRFSGQCDRLQSYEVQLPCNALVRALFVPAGSASNGAQEHPDAFIMDSYNFLSPVDESHTRYFWFQVFNSAAGDASAAQALAASVKAAFKEDQVILAAVQRGFHRADTPGIDLPTDSASLRFRRRVGAAIELEKHSIFQHTEKSLNQ